MQALAEAHEAVGYSGCQMEISCPACGAMNRVPESRADEPARCGKCQASLMSGGALARARAVVRRALRRRAVVVSLAIFAWFVWPTPYRDLPCSPGAASYDQCRHVNRITGAICPVSQTCWINPSMW